MPSTGCGSPGKSRAAVRYAAMAWSVSLCMANACAKATHAGANILFKDVALPKKLRADAYCSVMK